MNIKDNYPKKIYYIFEYGYDTSYKVEALTISDEKHIETGTYNTVHYISHFSFSYYLIGRHLHSKPYENPFQKKDKQNFSNCPALKLLIQKALSEENIEKTKVYFNNISLILKNKECHNEKSLRCLCELMNVKMPDYERNILDDIQDDLHIKGKDSQWFNYLKGNVKPIADFPDPIIAEGNVGFDVVNMVYKINSLLDLWLASLFILFNLKGTIKICQTCGKPFVIYKYNKKNFVYCSYNGDECRRKGRDEQEQKRYRTEKYRLNKNVYMKLKYRANTYETDRTGPWNNLYLNYGSKLEEYRKALIDDARILKWLKTVNSELEKHKKEPFELPDIE